MRNFEFHCDTKIIFGKDTEALVVDEIKQYGNKVLLVYYDVIKQIGLYDKVVGYLKEAGIEFVELSGVVPNPRLSLVKEGIELCRRENVDLILAVGGGSVIDTAKAIGMGVPYEGDVWDFFLR
ncbi:MAG TPA: NADH-dependent alcohol dehydrogenase, partial [Clostridiales bacterium UBA9857]|nr:NADH-dependent alcohol dehydrogenase [Clostridiales bacterium UBA9857]